MELRWTTTTFSIFLIYFFSLLNFILLYSCLAHVVNLGNVDVMGQITKIAAVENATAIWEYDPTQADNRVLGGSLDVITAIRTLAIKVSLLVSSNFMRFLILSTLRFKHLGSVLNTSTAPRSIADSLKPWRYHYIAISGGEQHSKCLTKPINFVRYGSNFISFIHRYH